MPLTGQVVGDRYKIEKRIGEGGMAVVHKARDMLLDRPVAVKVLREQFADDEEFVQRFRREARSAARLSHPNVVNIFDVGEWNGTHYIVMEYVDGENLKQILQRDVALPVERVVAVARGVAQALHHAHQHELIHRDVKPHNILLTREGQVKVTDFGIARATSSATLTQTGTVLGSVHYLSPEQAQGGPAGEASDIYSLGVLMYEMLTGHVPFQGESPIAVALKHLNDPPELPSRTVQDVPKPLEDVILQAMAKDPGDRFDGAAELFNALNGLPQQVGGAAFGPAPAREGTRNPEPDGGAYSDTDAFDPTTAEMATVPEWDEDAVGRDSGDDRGTDGGGGHRRRGRLWLWAAAVLVVLIWGMQLLLSHLFPPDVTVPRVVGLNLPEARRTLDERGLNLVVDEQLPSENVPEGRIMDQEPAPDRSVKAGRSVHVILSTGPEFVEVPDVVGLTLDEARLAIFNAGLTLGDVTEVTDPEVPPNRIISQEPSGNTPQPKGMGVDLLVSRGEEPVPTLFLPDFRGQPFDQVRAWLRANGLRVGNLYPSPQPQNAVVEEQNPLAHTEVEVGWEIDFVLESAEEALGGSVIPPDDGGPGAPPQEGGEESFQDALEVESPPVTQAPAGGEITGPSPAEQPFSERAPAAGPADDDEWREVELTVNVPPGPPQEVLVLRIDDLVGSEIVYQERHEGGDQVTLTVQGWGENAKVQVFIDTVLWLDESFSDLDQ